MASNRCMTTWMLPLAIILAMACGGSSGKMEKLQTLYETSRDFALVQSQHRYNVDRTTETITKYENLLAHHYDDITSESVRLAFDASNRIADRKYNAFFTEERCSAMSVLSSYMNDAIRTDPQWAKHSDHILNLALQLDQIEPQSFANTYYGIRILSNYIHVMAVMNKQVPNVWQLELDRITKEMRTIMPPP